jgi:hypothetical protein
MTTRWDAPTSSDVAKVRRLANSFVVAPADRPAPVSETVWLAGIAAALILATGLLIGITIGVATHGHPVGAAQCVFIAGIGVILLATMRRHR